MSSIPFEGEIAQTDVSWVAEMTNEPMYLAEIARKMIEWGIWDTNFTDAIIRASLAVQTMVDTRSEDEYMVEKIQPGQVEGSPHYVLGSGDVVFGGVHASKEWRPYKLFSNETGVTSDVIAEHIDPSITFEEKRRMVERVSWTGKEQSMIVEDIVQDIVGKVTRDSARFERTGFQSPAVDVYVEDFELTIPEVTEVNRGKVIEITNRWENPINTPYVDNKFSSAMEMEQESEFPVDVLVITPRLSGELATDVEESDGDRVLPVDSEGIVSVAIVPEEGQGIPVVRSDPFDVRQRLVGSEMVGADYPLAEETFEGFVNDLDHVERDYNVVLESNYRLSELEPVITEFLGET